MEEDLDLLTKIVDVIKNAEFRNEKCGVHCQLGQMRTGTVLAAYLAYKHKIDGKAAIKQLIQMRPKSMFDSDSERVICKFADSQGFVSQKWPCALEACISPNWRSEDTVVEFWDGLSGSIHCTERMSFSTFSLLSENVRRIIREAYLDLPLSTPRVVGVIWEPCIFAPVIIYGILGAGCAFFPVDYWSFEKQLFGNCDFIRAVIAVGHSSLIVSGDLKKHNFVPFHSEDDILNHRRDFKLYINRSAPAFTFDVMTCFSMDTPSNSRLAYIINSSGSTGEPKVIFVAHSCVSANVIDISQRLPENRGAGVLISSPLTFDACIVQYFVALLKCRRLVLPSKCVMFGVDGNTLTELVTSAGVDVWQCTPTIFSQLNQTCIHKLCDKWIVSVFVGGEACDLSALLSYCLLERLNLYLLYGVSEVSAWSSILKVSAVADNLDPPKVGATPIGLPMLHSSIDLREVDETTGIGQLYLSREGAGFCVASTLDGFTEDRRLCKILKSLTTIEPWPTGDFALRVPESPSLYWFVGRKDRMIKLFGHRLHMESLEVLLHRALSERVAERGLRVMHCHCNTVSTNRRCLRAYVRLTEARGTGNNDITSYEALYDEWSRSAIKDLRLKLLPIFLPRKIYFTFSPFVINKNGKLEGPPPLAASKESRVRTICDCIVGRPPSNSGLSFMELGGSSLSAVWLLDSLIHENLIAPEMKSELLAFLFSQPFCLFFEKIMKGPVLKPITHIPKKRLKLAPVGSYSFKIPKMHIISLFYEAAPHNLEVEAVWYHELGKCVDASALVATPDSKDTVVFVGSHSGCFISLKLLEGRLVWSKYFLKSDLSPSRIEAPAAYFHRENQSPSNYVVFGTLDGLIYALDASTGDTVWKLDIGGAVKAAPTVVKSLSLALIASHGCELFAIQLMGPSSGVPLWQRNLDGSPIVAGISVLETVNTAGTTEIYAFAGSLGGNLHCVNVSTSEILWTIKKLGPIFATPLVLIIEQSAIIFVVTADGGLFCASFANGCLVWSRRPSLAKGFFAAPRSFLPFASVVLAASQSGQLFAINPRSGDVVWVIDLRSHPRVNGASTAFLTTPAVLKCGDKPLILVGRTDGLLFACACPVSENEPPVVALVHTFPGETFSAPVLASVPTEETECYAIIGCRNDFVYTLRIRTPKR